VLKFFDLKTAENAVFGVIFAIFRESRRLMASHCSVLLASEFVRPGPRKQLPILI
jgi:hypothetical protein